MFTCFAFVCANYIINHPRVVSTKMAYQSRMRVLAHEILTNDDVGKHGLHSSDFARPKWTSFHQICRFLKQSSGNFGAAQRVRGVSGWHR